MRAAIYNDTFTAGQVLRSIVNGDLFSVEGVRDEETARHGVFQKIVVFRRRKTGELCRVPLETARRLMLEEAADL